jgi:hypothetical protein
MRVVFRNAGFGSATRPFTPGAMSIRMNHYHQSVACGRLIPTFAKLRVKMEDDVAIGPLDASRASDFGT